MSILGEIIIYKSVWKHKIKMKYQKLTRGYSDEDIWNLDLTLCEFLIPRLKQLETITICYPSRCKNLKQWKKELATIRKGLTIYLDNKFDIISSRDQKAIDKSFTLLKDNIQHLWD